MLKKFSILIFSLFLVCVAVNAHADPNLLGHYTFDSQNADDSSGNGHNGTGQGTVSYVYDAQRDSYVLSLTNGPDNWGNCVNIGGNSYDLLDPDWSNNFKYITVAAWTTIDEFNATYQYLAAKEGAWRMMRYNLEDKMRFYTNGTGSTSLVGDENSDIQGGDWHHVALLLGDKGLCPGIGGSSDTGGARAPDPPATGRTGAWAHEPCRDAYRAVGCGGRHCAGPALSRCSVARCRRDQR